MLAEPETDVTVAAPAGGEQQGPNDATRAAARALDTASQPTNAVPGLVLPGWNPPEDWKPYPTFEQASVAVADALARLRAAFRARVALSAPFIKDGPASQTYHYIFSRSADEAVRRCPNLPADLIAATRAEERARDEHEQARLRLTVTPAYGTDILRKLRFITTPIDNVFDPEEATDVEEALARPDEFPQSLEFFGLHDDIARAVSGQVQVDRTAWEEAVSRWVCALERIEPVVEADRLATLEINRQGPEELVCRGRFQDYGPKYLGPDCLNNDVLITGADKQRLREPMEAWVKERGRLLEEKFDDDEETWSRLHDEVDEAEAALLEVTPPSVAELVLQQRLAAARISYNDDDVRGGFDDLGWVAFNDEACWTRKPLTALHRNTLRLAGIDHPILHMEPFSPRGWIKAYEAQGLLVSHSRRGLILTIHADATADAPAARLRAELAETPWKYWAVHLSAHARREGGGDPIYDSHMGAGHNDRRGGGTKFFGTVQLADLIEFTRAEDETSPIPHVSRIDNRGRK